MVPLPMMQTIGVSGRFVLSCLWFSTVPAVRSFAPRSLSVLTMPVTRRTASEDSSPRRTRRRLLTSLEASSSNRDGTNKKQTIEEETIMKTEEVVASTPIKKKAPGPRKPASPRTHTPPANWQEVYALVEELRQDRTAPVDANGSESLPDRTRGEKVFRFQVLIALMLSSQTKDAVVGNTIRALQEYGLDVEKISQTSPEQLNSYINKVGFHNNKTKYIKQTVEILLQEYDGDIPPTASEIMKLPGVGPKMAFIVENVAWNTTTGIGIDTHMHRMLNELSFVKSNNPENTRLQLESWLPRELWPSVNVLWVGFGQEVQQFKPKIIRKALTCSQPANALRLIKRLGVDLKKEGEKIGVANEIQQALKS